MNCSDRCCRGKIPVPHEPRKDNQPRFPLTIFTFGVVGLFLFLTWIGSF